MSWITNQLSNLIKTNAKTIDKTYPFKDILYLDTGSITEGRIDQLQAMSLKDSPSRAKRLLDKEDIIYSTVRPINRHYGFFYDFPDNLVVSTGFVTITCNTSRIIPKFLYYYLTSTEIVEELDILAEASTTTYPSFRPSDLENLNIYLPSNLNEQKAIASVLSSLDDKIDLLHRQNKNLEAMCEAIFMQWFVDKKDYHIHRSFQQQNLMSLVVDIISGDWGKEFSEKLFNKEVLCIRGTDINSINNDLQIKIPTRYILNTNFIKKIIQHNDIIIEISGGSPTQSTGRTLFVKKILLENFSKPLICSNFCKIIRVKDNYELFFYHYLKIFYKQDLFFLYENGTTGIKNFDLTSFLEHETIGIPENEILKEFNSISNILLDKILMNKKQINILVNLRNNLLPKLMSGEVKVNF